MIYHMAKERTFSCGTNSGNPKRERCANLAHSRSLSEYRIGFIPPACGYSHIVIGFKWLIVCRWGLGGVVEENSVVSGRKREGGMKIVFVRRCLFLSIEQLQAAAEGVFLATAFCKYCNIHTVTTAELFTLSP